MNSPTAGRDGDWILLHNPRSKRATRARRSVESTANRLATELGVTLWWVEISALEAIEWNPTRLVAMGGDGTANAAASWIARRDAETKPILAIIPAGTGNNFARDAGLPLDPVEAISLAFSSNQTRSLDLLRFEELDTGAVAFALQSGSIGFPAQVSQRYDILRRYRLFRWVAAPFGQYVYRIIGAVLLAARMTTQLLGRRGIDTSVEFENERFEGELLALFVNNEQSLGGNFFPCPEADPTDGIVDLCLLRRGRARHYPGLFKAVCRASHVGRYDEAVYRRGTGAIEVELERSMPLLIDGDLPMQPRRFRAELLPGYLSLLVRSPLIP